MFEAQRALDEVVEVAAVPQPRDDEAIPFSRHVIHREDARILGDCLLHRADVALVDSKPDDGGQGPAGSFRGDAGGVALDRLRFFETSHPAVHGRQAEAGAGCEVAVALAAVANQLAQKKAVFRVESGG